MNTKEGKELCAPPWTPWRKGSIKLGKNNKCILFKADGVGCILGTVALRKGESEVFLLHYLFYIYIEENSAGESVIFFWGGGILDEMSPIVLLFRSNLVTHNSLNYWLCAPTLEVGMLKHNELMQMISVTLAQFYFIFANCFVF